MKAPVNTIVVKLGGNVLTDLSATAAIADDIATVIAQSGAVILVHGGGNLIDEHLKALGITLQKKQGLRVTDDQTLKAVQEILDFVNGDLVGRFTIDGLCIQGFNSTSGLLQAKQALLNGADGTQFDLGHVGEITGVNVEALKESLAQGKTPLVAPLAVGAGEKLFNINADEAASAIASALGADSLIFMSDVPGVLHKDGSKGSLPVISQIDFDQLVADGTVHSGMIPKLTKAFQALNTGVASVQIIDGREPGSLLKALSQPGINGTVVAA